MRISTILFSLDGRINRLQFWLGFAAITLYGMLSALAIIIAQSLLNPTAARILSACVLGLWLFVYLWVLIAISNKRWHDMNLSGVWSFLWLVPFVGPVVALIWLGFCPGQARHGHRHRSHSHWSSSRS